MPHKNVVVEVFVVTLVLVVCAAPSHAQNARPPAFVDGELLVQFVPGASAAARANAHTQGGGSTLGDITTDLELVSVPAGNEVAAIARYERSPNVLYAEPNYLYRIPEPLSHSASSEIVPGDFYFGEQWALRNTGQQFYCILPGFCFYIGTPDADVDAPEAWPLSTGLGVSVAVIDSGVDFSHPDLAHAYAGVWEDLTGSNPMDVHGHGTHVAGTIAAAFNNLTGGVEEGIAGVAPEASILSYKVCSEDGSCRNSNIVRAIARAVDAGARVINMSLGGTSYSRSLDNAVQDAWNANVVVVAGAGNNGSTSFFYPAALPNVVSVAAYDEDHLRPSFSNYGAWVDISAPGNVIMSSYPLAACGGLGEVSGDTGCFTWSTGTSMATPHVSGAAALLWGRADLTTNAQVVQALLGGADPQGMAATRLDTWTVHGGLNLHDALSYGITNIAPTADAGEDQALIDNDEDGFALVQLQGEGADPDGYIVEFVWSENDVPFAWIASPVVPLPVGVHTLKLTVRDDDGETGSDEVLVAIDAPADPPPGGATASVQQVAYSTSGGPGGTRHLNIELTLVDDVGNPLVGAIVAVTVANTTGSEASGSDTTGTEGTVTFSWKNAPPTGCFDTDVSSVEAGALTWDGLTPVNEFCR